LLRLKENQNFFEQENKFNTEKLKQENELEKLRLGLSHLLEVEKLKQRQELNTNEKQFDLAW
jgi:hypothetical protein